MSVKESNMNDKGARLGWTLGGLGGLLWMVVLGILLLTKGNLAAGLSTLGFFLAGIVYLVVFAPWKHPRTQLRWIYLGLIAIVIGAAGVLLRLWHPAAWGTTIRWHSVSWVLPLFLPVFIFGRKTWPDLHAPGK